MTMTIPVTPEVSTNGNGNGRRSQLVPFTFGSTGVTVMVKPVPPFLMNEARKSIKKPVPPQQPVENADGTTRLESNPSHPDYIAALDAYEGKLAVVGQRMMIKRGVVLDLSDEQRAELATLRTEMEAEGVTTLDPDDKIAYILYIAAGSALDIAALIKAITERGQPTDPKLTSG